MPTLPLTGGCHCGYCQKISGAAFTTNVSEFLPFFEAFRAQGNFPE